MWSVLSWLAVAAGFTGTWLAGRHHQGWLVTLTCSLLWLGYDLRYSIWAGALAAVVGAVLNVRNWRIGHTKRETTCTAPTRGTTTTSKQPRPCSDTYSNT